MKPSKHPTTSSPRFLRYRREIFNLDNVVSIDVHKNGVDLRLAYGLPISIKDPAAGVILLQAFARCEDVLDLTPSKLLQDVLKTKPKTNGHPVVFVNVDRRSPRPKGPRPKRRRSP